MQRITQLNSSYSIKFVKHELSVVVLHIVNNVEKSILESLVVPTRVGREYMEMNKVNRAMKA